MLLWILLVLLRLTRVRGLRLCWQSLSGSHHIIHPSQQRYGKRYELPDLTDLRGRDALKNSKFVDFVTLLVTFRRQIFSTMERREDEQGPWYNTIT